MHLTICQRTKVKGLRKKRYNGHEKDRYGEECKYDEEEFFEKESDKVYEDIVNCETRWDVAYGMADSVA